MRGLGSRSMAGGITGWWEWQGGASLFALHGERAVRFDRGTCTGLCSARPTRARRAMSAVAAGRPAAVARRGGECARPGGDAGEQPGMTAAAGLIICPALVAVFGRPPLFRRAEQGRPARPRRRAASAGTFCAARRHRPRGGEPPGRDRRADGDSGTRGARSPRAGGSLQAPWPRARLAAPPPGPPGARRRSAPPGSPCGPPVQKASLRRRGRSFSLDCLRA